MDWPSVIVILGFFVFLAFTTAVDAWSDARRERQGYQYEGDEVECLAHRGLCRCPKCRPEIER